MLLKMNNIIKTFPGVKALKGVNLTLKSGEVLGLLGENGAGKSTLIKVLGGICQADDGEIFINDELVHINSVGDACKKGISIIHQEIVLVPYLSVAANIFLGREPVTATGFIDKNKVVSDTRKLFEEFGVDINPNELICNLSIAQQQLVEIVKASSTNSKIIVMDEPTSSLSENETMILFRTIAQLKKKGTGIIYISHRISELYEIAERVTVLRDGIYIETVELNKTDPDMLINLMVGRKLEAYYTKNRHKIGEKIFEVSNLNKAGVYKDINFYVRAGEIIGFYGLIGSGRTEVMKSAFGIMDYDSGEVLLNNEVMPVNSPKDSINKGIAYLPENRKEEGLVLINTVGFNMTLVSLGKIVNRLHVNEALKEEIVKRYVDAFKIKITSSAQVIGNLSGGNQQKAIIGKWLATNPKVLILDEPTRGIDVSAKADIYKIIDDLAESGVAVIFISSEMPEIINMCDRVYIMCEGSIKAELGRAELSQETIMYYSAGGEDL